MVDSDMYMCIDMYISCIYESGSALSPAATLAQVIPRVALICIAIPKGTSLSRCAQSSSRAGHTGILSVAWPAARLPSNRTEVLLQSWIQLLTTIQGRCCSIVV